MPNSLNKLYIGTMSGTSYDGIDVCAISVRKKIDLIHFSSFKYPPKLRKKIAAVIEDQILSLKDYGELNIEIGLAFAKAINKFIKQNNFSTSQIVAIGLSGQTLWHNPQGKYPFSIQAGDAAIVSKECCIDVVHDFRNDHISLGGEGAPLVPEFHQKLFSISNQDRLILNIGGISNYSYLTKSKDFFGSDSGPGNALLDSYCQKFLDQDYDRNGLLARKGKVHKASLNKMLAHPFFKKRQPKSTGKEIFNIRFIPKSLLQQSPESILATLTELTAKTIVQAIKHKQQSINEIIVCGGGIKNLFLIERISHYISLPIVSSELMGYSPQSIEAMAFGWLASQKIANNPLIVGNKEGVLGKITKFKS
ncbi:anhydro-N-acetylmuramic acid kinase [Gammaproteobacteria bacterium]|nr:anhydro-N-acetylmuramic acid kinase [Gammaproteobacteria bacterium]